MLRLPYLMGFIVMIPWEIRKQETVLTARYSGLKETVVYFGIQFLMTPTLWDSVIQELINSYFVCQH